MTYLHQICSAAAKKILGLRPIYAATCAYARVSGTMALPQPDEALRILEAASPRPPRWSGPRRREWPDMPQVDITFIVPCYNAERYVDDCIKSILSQETSCSFEVLAIDDGSVDATAGLLDTIALNDSRVRVVHQANRGFSGARNVGIDLARGGAIAFVDSDDVLLPGAIDVLASAYNEGGCDFVTANYETMSQDGLRITPPEGVRCHGAPWGRLYSREIWRSLSFPEDFWFEDTVQPFCIDTVFEERYIERAVYRYRNNSAGITANCIRYKKGLDTFWIVDELLAWCRSLGVPFTSKLFEATLYQMGPLLLSRTAALNARERRALFAAACDLIASIPEFDGLETGMGERWGDVLLALRGRNYLLWRAAASF